MIGSIIGPENGMNPSNVLQTSGVKDENLKMGNPMKSRIWVSHSDSANRKRILSASHCCLTSSIVNVVILNFSHSRHNVNVRLSILSKVPNPLVHPRFHIQRPQPSHDPVSGILSQPNRWQTRFRFSKHPFLHHSGYAAISPHVSWPWNSITSLFRLWGVWNIAVKRSNVDTFRNSKRGDLGHRVLLFQGLIKHVEGPQPWIFMMLQGYSQDRPLFAIKIVSPAPFRSV
jgi:hypothetical protein